MDNKSSAQLNVKAGTLATEEYIDGKLKELREDILKAITEQQKPEKPEEPEVPGDTEDPGDTGDPGEPEKPEEPESDEKPCGGGPEVQRIISINEKELEFEFWGMDTSRIFVKIESIRGRWRMTATTGVTSAKVKVPLPIPIPEGEYTLSIRALNCTYKETSIVFQVEKDGKCANCDMTIGNITVQ